MSKLMPRLFPAIALSALGFAAAPPALALDLSAMSESEEAAFGEAVRDYLMENPQVLVEAINALESRRMEQQAENDKLLVSENSDAIFDDGHSWVGGNPEGDLTMVEFIDYRCGVCRQVVEQVTDAVEKDGNIRLVLKEFPILGQQSDLSSRFAVAVQQQAGDAAYAEVHDLLFAMRGPATLESLRKLAEDQGLDASAIMQAMNGDAVNDVLRKNAQLAQILGIQGTPSFIIGDELLRGVPRAGLASVIEAARAAAAENQG